MKLTAHLDLGDNKKNKKMNNNNITKIREIGKKKIGYDRMVALMCKHTAENCLFFWLEGYLYKEKEELVDVIMVIISLC